MRIGFMFRTFGAPGGDRPVPTWEMVRHSYLAADRVGFDVFTYEDALMYRTDDITYGVMESMSLSAALAATPAAIHFGQSVINAPYRTGGMLAKMAVTIDEISGGRYRLGIGAGNTEDSDYRAFGYPTDKRFSRFADKIRIVHSLLKTGAADHVGEYDFAENAEMVLRGPRPEGPPIEIAAKGPKMLRLVARYADIWNWWSVKLPEAVGELAPLVEELERACEEEGRDPSTLERSYDVYSIDLLGVSPEDKRFPEGHVVHGTAEQIAEQALAMRDLGFDEVRFDHVVTPTADAMVERVDAMAELVDLIHAG